MRQKVFLDIREVPKILECVVKNIGGKILRLITVVNSSSNKCVDPLEIILVKLGEAGWVALRGLDHAALWRILAPMLQCRFSSQLRPL